MRRPGAARRNAHLQHAVGAARGFLGEQLHERGKNHLEEEGELLHNVEKGQHAPYDHAKLVVK